MSKKIIEKEDNYSALILIDITNANLSGILYNSPQEDGYRATFSTNGVVGLTTEDLIVLRDQINETLGHKYGK